MNGIFARSLQSAGMVLVTGLTLSAHPAGRLPDFDRHMHTVRKVLMIGNSFSESVLVDLPSVVRSTGDRMILVNLMIGGCPLKRHWENYVKSETDPTFKPYSVQVFYDGERHVSKTPLSRVAADGRGSLQGLLAAEKWDLVTLQQGSSDSWKPETYQPYADNLIGSVRQLASRAEIAIHQTWAYNLQENLDQKKMHDGLCLAYGKLAARHGLRIIPTGDAMQSYRDALPVRFRPLDEKARAAVKVGDIPDMQGEPVGFFYWNTGYPWEKRDPNGDYRLRWDGRHLNPEGKYLQALVWYACVFGGDPRQVSYVPEKLDGHRAAVMRQVATRVTTPWRSVSADASR